MKTLLSLESLLKENETLEKRVFSVRSVRTSLLYIKRKEKREKKMRNRKAFICVASCKTLSLC